METHKYSLPDAMIDSYMEIEKMAENRGEGAPIVAQYKRSRDAILDLIKHQRKQHLDAQRDNYLEPVKND